MAKAMQFDVGMDNGEFMRGSKDIARAINSLKSTVVAAGKSMNSSAIGYGTAMRQSIQAGRQFEQSIQGIKSRMEALRGSVSSIKSAADEFRQLDSQIKKSADELEKMVEKYEIMQDMGLGGPTNAWIENQKAIEAAEKEVEEYERKFDDMLEIARYDKERYVTGRDEEGYLLPKDVTESYYEEAQGSYEKMEEYGHKLLEAEANLEALRQTQSELKAGGEDLPTPEYEQLAKDISRADIELADMRTRLAEMREKGYENADQSGTYQDQVRQLQDLENELDNARAKKEEALKPPYMRSWEQMITLSGMISEGFGRIQNAAAGALYAIQHPVEAIDRAFGTLIVKATQAAASFARMAGNSALSFLRKLASTAQNAAIQLAKLASSAVHGAFQKLAQGASAAGKGLLGLIKNNNAANGSFKRSFMTILKYAFGVRSMYFLFRRLRSAVTEAFKEMAKSSPEVKSAMNSLQAALNGLKGSLATAFAPIFTAIAPALTYLINMLTAAMNTIGAFFAALTGQNSYQRAVGAATDAGKTASKSAKKAKKDVKDLKRELLGFDELNIINDNNKDNTDSGAGKTSGISFKKEAVPGGIKDFVDKLKEMWNNGEYVKIGKLMADWINKAIQKAKEFITWENVADKIQEFVDKVAGIMEGLLIYVDWKNIGDTIAEAFRTVTNTIDTFMQKVGVFMLAGSALAAMVNGFFGNKKLWTDIGRTITDSVHSFLSFGQAFLDGFDAEEAGRGIRSAILTVGDKLPEIAAEFWELVKTAFNKAGSFVNALLGGSEEQPDLSKYVRPKPITANPKVTVDNSIWDDLAENLSTGFNTVIEKLTKSIEAQPVGETVAALAGWITKLKNGINWEAVGNIIGASFQKALEGIGTAIAAFAENAQKTGEDLGKAINAAIRKVKWTGEGEDTVQGLITNLFKGAIGLVKGLFGKFDTAEFVKSLKGALEGVPWGDIAKDIWDFITEELAKLGNILTTLLGGEVTVPKPEVKKPGMTGSGNQNVAVPDTGTGTRTQNGVTPASLAEAIGAAVSAALTKLDEWIGKIPWDEWGTKVNEFLTNLPWEEWGSKLAHALFDLLSNIDDFISAATFGENYKDNDVWRFFHSGKAAEHDVQQMASSSSNLDEVLSKHGLTQESFASLKQLADSPIIGDPDMLTAVQEAQQKVAEIMAELDLDGTQTALEENTEALANNTTNGGSAEVSGNVGVDVSMNGESGTAEEAANSIADGFTDTLEGRKDEMVSAVEDPIVEANKNVHDDIEMGSPSALYESYGNSIVDGLILGLQDLPSKLQTIWNLLPEWAKTMFSSLGETLGVNINANSSGRSGTVTDKGAKKGVKVTAKETKAVTKLTKEVKKNTAARPEVNVNYEGAGFDTSEGKPKLNVGVDFVPNSEEEASDEVKNEGLLGWLQELLNADTLEAKIALIRDNWNNVVEWFHDNGYIGDTLYQLINLGKEGKWADVVDWFERENLIGPTLSQLIKLALNGDWDSVVDWFEKEKLIGPTLSQLIKLAKEGKWKDVIDWFDREGFFGPALSQVVELAKQGRWHDVLDWFKENGYLSENIDQLVQLVKDGNWTGVIDWLMKNNLFGPKLQQLVDLIKAGNWNGVLDWLKENKLFGPAVEQLVTLIRDGNWDGVIDWLKQKGLFGETLAQLVGLAKDGNWGGIIDWLKQKGLFGETLAQLVGLAKDGNWTGIIDWLKQKGLAGPAIEQLVTLVKDNWQTFLGFLGIDTNNPMVKTIVNMLFGKDGETKEAKDIIDKKQTNYNVKTSLTKVNWNTLDSFVGTIKEKGVKLAKDGWDKLSSWVGNIGEKKFSLGKDSWTTVSNFVGDIGTKVFSLGKDSWTTISGFVGEIGTKAFSLGKDKWKTISNFVGDIGTKKFSLGKNKWSTIAKYVGDIGEKKFSLGKDKWSTVRNYVGDIGTKAFSLGKDSWTTISSFVGNIGEKKFGLGKDNWDTISNYVGDIGTKAFSLGKDNWDTISNFAGDIGEKAFSLGKDNWDTISNYVGDIGTKDVTIDATAGNGFESTENGFKLSNIQESDVKVNAKTDSGTLISNIFSKIGSWLFGTDNTPETDAKVNAVAGNGFSGVGDNGNMTLQGISDTDVGINFKNNTFSNGIKQWLTDSYWGNIDIGIDFNNNTFTGGIRKWLTDSYWGNIDIGINFSNNTFSDGILNWLTGNYWGSIWITVNLQQGWYGSLSDWIGNSVTVSVNLSAGGGVIKDGYKVEFAKGGVIKGGLSRFLENVPHYAGGTTRAHGTVFVAGESGPEVMGHINGRTEILNKAQIAEAIYSAVVHGMGQAVNALGKYLANHMTNCTNSIVQTIGANSAIATGVDYYTPAVASGGIMPYDVAMQIARSTQDIQNTLDANNEELIQAMISAVGNAAQSIVQAMATQMIRGNGVRGVSSRQVIEDINRAGQMFGQSPIKGV